MRKTVASFAFLLCTVLTVLPAGAQTRHAGVRIRQPQVRVSRHVDVPSSTTTTTWPAVKEHIAACESGGNYLARNRHSTASGKYQFLNTTWAGRFGVKHAFQATPEQQEQAAAELFDRSGVRPWKASERCWKKRLR